MHSYDALTTIVDDRRSARMRDAEAYRTGRLQRRARQALTAARAPQVATPVPAPVAPATAPAPTFLVASPGASNLAGLRDHAAA